MKLKMIIGGLAAAVVVLTGGYDRLRDYVEPVSYTHLTLPTT